MKSIIYTSRCIFSEFDAHDLDIFRKALSHNALVGINGFLHRTKTHYIQYIDGPDTEISRLVDKLYADHRHSDMAIVREEQICATKFPGWSMGYSRVQAHPSQPRIDPACSADEMFRFLLHEANVQMQMMRAKEARLKLTT